MHDHRPARHRFTQVVTVATLLAVASACRSVAPRLGANPAQARITADDFFGGVATRYNKVFREPWVRTSRRKIMRALLLPSNLFSDPTIWSTTPNASTRVLAFRGVGEADRYHFLADTARRPPAHPGDGRHEFQLRRLDANEFEWLATSEFGIGATTPEAFANIPIAWIAAGERADTAAIRRDIHAAFPRSAAAWGRLFSLVSIATSRDDGGAWRQRATIVLRHDTAAARYPALDAWLRKYVSPLRIHIRLHDSTRTWFDVVVRGDTMVVNTRSRDGRVLPLEGGEAFLPDTATLETDFSARLLTMRAGFHALKTDFVSVRQPSARGWSLHFTHDPDWDLPPLAEQLLRAPLRRPFRGTGSIFRVVAVSDPAQSQTVLATRILAPVEESAIYRFLSYLISGGISEYVEGADRDLNAWMSASFGALRDDARALLPP